MRAVVLGLRKYDFEDDNNQRVQGVSLNYVMPHPSEEDDVYGHLPMKESISPDLGRQLTEVPGVYELHHEMRPGRNSRPTPTLVGLSFVGPFPLDATPVASEEAS